MTDVWTANSSAIYPSGYSPVNRKYQIGAGDKITFTAVLDDGEVIEDEGTVTVPGLRSHFVDFSNGRSLELIGFRFSLKEGRYTYNAIAEHADIQHICGHTHNHSLFGAYQENEGKKRWLKRRVCPLCYYGADRPGSEYAVVDRAEHIMAGLSIPLPALAGTEKQIAWGNTLRAERIIRLRDRVCASLYAPVLSGLTENETIAHRWIDDRDKSDDYILRKIISGIAWDEFVAAGRIKPSPRCPADNGGGDVEQ
ncbi:hypothetical protein [Pararhizobium haloflavum]|uniref:hypothetical protein n=1 Tax=Pararhizobium haloflavum TaxID=2037914 RepID=UPI000C17C284|nr:hypothetical protein [Pararhizobium haloflavum]